MTEWEDKRVHEKEIAVLMWKNISDSIRSGTIRDIYGVDEFKIKWCKKHGVEWKAECYLCEHYYCHVPDGRNCPLYLMYGGDCSSGRNNPYYKLTNAHEEYSDDELGSFADIAECIAECINEEKKCVSD